MTEFVKTLTVGDGMDKASKLGPVQNEMQYRKLRSLVASIKSEGLNVLTGDLDKTFLNDKGYFVDPVVVDNPPETSRIVTEEPFGMDPNPARTPITLTEPKDQSCQS